MKNIIFIAPPAAGKGTQSKLVSEEYNIPHISTGDLLREEVNKKTALGLEIKKLIDEGCLVSDEVITELLTNRLQQADCNNGFILDGYPRNINQAEKLDILLSELGKTVDAVIYLEVDEELAMKRATGRISCPNCKRSYHKYFMKPKQDNICDNCGATLISRADDTEDAFKIRYNTYIENTKPLLDFYDKKGVLVRVDANRDASEAFEDIEKVIK